MTSNSIVSNNARLLIDLPQANLEPSDLTTSLARARPPSPTSVVSPPPAEVDEANQPVQTGVATLPRREILNPLRLTDGIARPEYRRAATFAVGNVAKAGVMAATWSGLAMCSTPVAIGLVVGQVVASDLFFRPWIGDAGVNILEDGVLTGVFGCWPVWRGKGLGTGLKISKVASNSVLATFGLTALNIGMANVDPERVRRYCNMVEEALEIFILGSLLVVAAASASSVMFGLHLGVSVVSLAQQSAIACFLHAIPAEVVECGGVSFPMDQGDQTQTQQLPRPRSCDEIVDRSACMPSLTMVLMRLQNAL